ncbi:MAG: HAD-IIB family hydrolase [Bacilli bacterium]
MKVLVSDFDETFFTDEYLENIERVNSFVDNGNMFIIATGRNIKQLKKDIDQYYIKFSYLICNDGAMIFDKDLNLLNRIDIDLKTTKIILKELENDPNVNAVYIDNGFEHVKEITINNNAVLGKYNDQQIAIDNMNKLMEKYNEIHGYISFNWINITNSQVSKGNAIKYLVDYLNLNEKDIYPIGDGINDISMVQMYNGYYMKKNNCVELEKVGINSVNTVRDLMDIIEKQVI